MHRPQQRGGSGTRRSGKKELQLALLVPQCISLKVELFFFFFFPEEKKKRRRRKKIGEQHEAQGAKEERAEMNLGCSTAVCLLCFYRSPAYQRVCPIHHVRL